MFLPLDYGQTDRLTLVVAFCFHKFYFFTMFIIFPLNLEHLEWYGNQEHGICTEILYTTEYWEETWRILGTYKTSCRLQIWGESLTVFLKLLLSDCHLDVGDWVSSEQHVWTCYSWWDWQAQNRLWNSEHLRFWWSSAGGSWGYWQDSPHQGTDGVHSWVETYAVPCLSNHEGIEQSHLVWTLHQWSQVG